MPNLCEPNGYQPVYNTPTTGVIDVDNANEQLPDVACKLVMLQADSDNTGVIYLVDGSGDTTEGWRLDAGDVTPWLPLDNLSRLYAYGSAANQNLRYVALS